MSPLSNSLRNREEEPEDPDQFERTFGDQFQDVPQMDAHELALLERINQKAAELQASKDQFLDNIDQKAAELEAAKDEFMATNMGQFMAYGARSAKIATKHGGGKKGWAMGLFGGLSSGSKGKLLLLSAGPTLVVIAAITIFILMAGPLQVVHAAQILEKFHFGAVNSFVDNRTSKIFRYYKWQDKPQNRRLTLIGNALADRIDADYAKRGMELDFDSQGRLRNIVLNTEKFPGQELDRLRDDFTVSDPDRSGKVRINTENLSGRQSRALYARTRGSLGMDGFGGYVQARLTANRINPSMFHPLKKLDEIILKDAAKAREVWLERKKAIVETGEAPQIRGSPDATDEDGNPKPNISDDVAGELADVATVDPELEGGAKVNAVKSNLLAKAGAVNMITGLTCLIYTLGNVAGDMEFTNVVEPSMRAGGYHLGLGSQAQNQTDTDATQLGFENESFFDESDDGDPNTHPSSFFDARSIQVEQGKPPTGPDTPNSARVGGSTNVLTQITDSIPDMGQWLLSGGCGIISSPVGQAFTLGIDLYLAPASALAGFAASFATGPLLDDLARYIAGEEVSTDLAGAAKGAVANQGVFFMANQQFITNGATALTEPQRAELRETILTEQHREASEKSWSERYFALDNADSLLSTMARNKAPNAGQAMASLLNIPKVFASVANVFTSRAHAQVQPSYNYGIPKFGYPVNALAVSETDESFANPYENAKAIDAKIPEMHEQFGEKCFGLKFDANEHFEMTQLINQKKLAEDAEFSDCRRTDAEYLHYKLYIADLMQHVAVACWKGDAASCTELGFGAGASASLNSPAQTENNRGYLGMAALSL